MTVEKLRQYILPYVFWNFMYREEVKRNLQSFTQLLFFPKVTGEVVVSDCS
jgi:hypothetical protein